MIAVVGEGRGRTSGPDFGTASILGEVMFIVLLHMEVVRQSRQPIRSSSEVRVVVGHQQGMCGG